jgi:hypothetical protein
MYGISHGEHVLPNLSQRATDMPIDLNVCTTSQQQMLTDVNSI